MTDMLELTDIVSQAQDELSAARDAIALLDPGHAQRRCQLRYPFV